MQWHRAVALITLAACSHPPAVRRVSSAGDRWDHPPLGLPYLRHAAAAASISLEVAEPKRRSISSRGCPHSAGGVVVDLRARYGCQRCTLVTSDSRGPGLGVLGVELQRYPESFLRAAGLEKISLCVLLTMDIDGIDTEVLGTVDLRHRRMFLSVGTDLIEHTFHHELYHLFDHATSTWNVDPEWDGLTPPAFSYLESGGTVLPDREPGFLTEYAKTNLLEDRAEVFSLIVSRPEWFCEQAAADPILLAKARLIHSRVARAIPTGDARRLFDAPCLENADGDRRVSSPPLERTGFGPITPLPLTARAHAPPASRNAAMQEPVDRSSHGVSGRR